MEAALHRGLSVTETAMAAWIERTHAALPREVKGSFRYSDGWFREFIGRIFRDGLGLDDGALADLQDELLERFADPATYRLFPGATELLHGLRSRGVRIGIVSNWGPRLESILQALGVRQLVDGTWVSAVERVEKPDPVIFQRACSGLNVEPAAALHVGDQIKKDIAGPNAAGMEAVLIDHHDRHTDFAGRRLSNLLDLLECLPERGHDGS